MAEMTEIDALKVKLADKQLVIDNASVFEATTMQMIAALKDGSLTLDRVEIGDHGYRIIPAVEAEAMQTARDAE